MPIEPPEAVFQSAPAPRAPRATSALPARALGVTPAPDAKLAWIRAIEACETPPGSQLDILDVNGKMSYGLLKFQMSTWLSYGKPFGATRENIHDQALQEMVARSMLDHGGWRNWWTCARKVEKNLGAYP